MPSTRSSATAEPVGPGRSPASRSRRLLLATIGVVILAVVTGITLVAVGGDEAPSPANPPGASAPGAPGSGDAAPPFSLPRLRGDALVELGAYRGRPVLVNFWASWCGPCRDEFPLLREARSRYPDLVVIGITYRDIASDSRRFARDQDAGWLLARDDGAVARAYGVRAIPQTFFITRNGNIRERVFGLTSADDLHRSIDAIYVSSQRK